MTSPEKQSVTLTPNIKSRFKGLVGTAYQLKQVCEKLGYQRAPELKNCQTYFPLITFFLFFIDQCDVEGDAWSSLRHISP